MNALLCLCHFYIQGGLAYVLPHESAADYTGRAGAYWTYDRNHTANPLGQLQLGYAVDHKRWRVDLYTRHESFVMSTSDRGENSLGLSVRYQLFK